MKPVIGVIADVYAGAKHVSHTVQQKYLDAVTGGANAIAVILPALIDAPCAAWTDPADFDQVFAMLDGLFLTGAVSNVEPLRYGATLADPNSPADPARDHVSFGLIGRAIARGLPLMGICRGFQEINAALGGTLHQAIHAVPGFSDHRENPDADLARQYAPAHAVTFAPGGLLSQLTGLPGTDVNSLHGQGVDRLAPPLVEEAVSPDGVIEAFRLANPAKFLLGVQWHPEWHFREDPVSRAMFRAFGDAARAYRNAGKTVSSQAA